MTYIEYWQINSMSGTNPNIPIQAQNPLRVTLLIFGSMLLLVLFFFVGANSLITFVVFGIIAAAIMMVRQFESQQRDRKDAPIDQLIKHSTKEQKEKESDPEMVWVEGYPEQIKACCYQTARLFEIYCPCGRAIESELQVAINQHLSNA